MKNKIEKIIKASIDVDLSLHEIKCGKFYFSWIDLVPFTLLTTTPLPFVSLLLGVDPNESLKQLILPLLMGMVISLFVIFHFFQPIHKKRYNAGKIGSVVLSELLDILRLKDFYKYEYLPDSLTEREQAKLLEILMKVIKIEKSKWKELSIAEKEIVCEIEDFIGDGYDFSKKITKLFIIFEKNKNLIVVENK